MEPPASQTLALMKELPVVWHSPWHLNFASNAKKVWAKLGTKLYEHLKIVD